MKNSEHISMSQIQKQKLLVAKLEIKGQNTETKTNIVVNSECQGPTDWGCLCLSEIPIRFNSLL